MAKTITRFHKVTFDWMMPPAERHQVEDVLKTLGYDVDGGGTDLEARVSEIFVRPKARSHKRRTPSAGPQAT
jgi:hypothetical protein